MATIKVDQGLASSRAKDFSLQTSESVLARLLDPSSDENPPVTWHWKMTTIIVGEFPMEYPNFEWISQLATFDYRRVCQQLDVLDAFERERD